MCASGTCPNGAKPQHHSTAREPASRSGVPSWETEPKTCESGVPAPSSVRSRVQRLGSFEADVRVLGCSSQEQVTRGQGSGQGPCGAFRTGSAQCTSPDAFGCVQVLSTAREAFSAPVREAIEHCTSQRLVKPFGIALSLDHSDALRGDTSGLHAALRGDAVVVAIKTLQRRSCMFMYVCMYVGQVTCLKTFQFKVEH